MSVPQVPAVGLQLYARDIPAGKIKFRVTRKLNLVKREFDIVEAQQYDTPGMPTVLVFRPRHYR